MSQLIQMRQRIKAIETIKKVTHAMRLISMSTHSQLKNKEEPLYNYQESITTMFNRITSLAPTWHNAILSPDQENDHLIILTGSQKGLCGNFNESLFKFFEKNNFDTTATFITIGKQATEYANRKKISTLVATYNHFSSATVHTITQSVREHITGAARPYSRVSLFANSPFSFFAQNPRLVPLIPFDGTNIFAKDTAEQPVMISHDYTWEQQPEDILNVLAYQCLEATLHRVLFESLVAEQAARFISMDSSTRNAKNLLEATRMQYNKLRQAKITKELTELVGSF